MLNARIESKKLTKRLISAPVTARASCEFSSLPAATLGLFSKDSLATDLFARLRAPNEFCDTSWPISVASWFVMFPEADVGDGVMLVFEFELSPAGGLVLPVSLELINSASAINGLIELVEVTWLFWIELALVVGNSVELKLLNLPVAS